MNRWKRSVGEIQARRRLVTECERAHAGFSKVAACFQQLATFVGSSSDSSRLREELEGTRVLAYTISTGLEKRLTTLLTEADLGPEERDEAERLWVRFLSGLEIFQQDLNKVCNLQDLFPLRQVRDRRALVNTGITGDGSGVAAQVATVQTPWLKTAEEPNPDLKTHITQLEIMAQEMLQKVNVPIWAVVATQEAWVESSEAEQDDDTADEMLAVEAVATEADRGSCCCHYPGCRILCLLT